MLKNVIIALFFLLIMYFGIITHKYPIIIVVTYLCIIPFFYVFKIKEELKTFKIEEIYTMNFSVWIRIIICIISAVQMIFSVELLHSSSILIYLFFALKIIFSIEAISYLIMALANEKSSGKM
jgi:hypothetical protein